MGCVLLRPSARRAVAVLGGVSAAASSCVSLDSEYECRSAPECVLDGRVGACDNGYCSFRDEDCPGTHRRYVARYAGPLSGLCVAPPEGGAGAQTKDGSLPRLDASALDADALTRATDADTLPDGRQSDEGGHASADATGAHWDSGDAGSVPCPVCESAASVCVRSHGPACGEPASALHGQRWNAPCQEVNQSSLSSCWLGQPGANPCAAFYPVDREVVFGGDPGVVYQVTLRFRGIVEPKRYLGGVATDTFHVYRDEPALPANSLYNTYGFEVSEPSATYFLNSAPETDHTFAIDFERTIPVAGGALVRLVSFAPGCGVLRNCTSYANLPSCTPHIVEGVSPYPNAYDGQFVQMDVVRVALGE